MVALSEGHVPYVHAFFFTNVYSIQGPRVAQGRGNKIMLLYEPKMWR